MIGTAGAGGALLVPSWRTAASLATPELAREARFTQSVAAGQPSTASATLWTRLDGLTKPARLQYEVSTDPGFRTVVARKTVTASPEDGFSVHARVGGLEPREQYWYRFVTCDAESPVGRFRTALPADSREPVRIGFFSCQDYQSGFYTAHTALASEQDLDLVVCLGDYVYERGFYTGPRKDTTGANKDAEVQTLAEYRDKYALYHSDPNLLAMRQAHALIAITDDHEVEDNYAADQPGEATQNKRVEFLERRANGYKAFFEHMPRLRTPGDADRTYGRMLLGANADLLFLDERQYRSDQPCGDSMAQPCPEADEPGRTMLGAAQKTWFKDALAGSPATWKLIGNQLMFMSLDVTPGQPLVVDSWDGYTAERRELAEFIRDRRIQDVAFLTGDIHTFFAGVCTPSGRGGNGQPPAVATEFVGGSITSQGIADRYGGEGGRDGAAFPIDSGVPVVNPHIVFSNQSFKGYGVLEARPDELLVQYKAPRTVTAERSDVFTLARFRVPKGEARVEVL